MSDIEDNVEDDVPESVLQQLWSARHELVDTTKTKMRDVLREFGFGDRRQYNAPPPSDVEERRKWNDMLKIINDIHTSSKNNNSILRTIEQIFSWGGKQFDKRK